MWHWGGGTGCASGAGQLFSSHPCRGASCFTTITSPSCYRMQLGRKVHPFGHYWHRLDTDIKLSMIWFSICCLTQPADRGSVQAALTRSAQKSTFGVDIAGDGAPWWRLMKKVMSWVLIAWFASETVCIWVFNATQKCQRRERIFIWLLLVPLKMSSCIWVEGSSAVSSDMEHCLSLRQTVILLFCIIYSEGT